MRNGNRDFFNDNTTGPFIWQEQALYMFYLLVLLFPRNLFEIHQIKVFFLINKICDDIYTGIDPDCYHRSIFSASSYIRLEISMKFVLQHRKTLKIIAPRRSSSTIVTHASWKKVEIVLIVLEKSFRPFVIIIILTFIAKLTDFRGRNRKSL